MSHTVHHVPSRHRKPGSRSTPWYSICGGPFTANSLTELRYSAAEMSAARAAGRRAEPALLVRSFAAYSYPRALGVRVSGRRRPEAGARAALRAFRTSARGRLNAAGPGELLDVAEDLDHPPTRHRHIALWEY